MHQKLVWRAGRYDHIDDIAAGRPVGQLSDAQMTLYEIVPIQNSIRINLRKKKLLFLLQGKDNGETRYLCTYKSGCSTPFRYISPEIYFQGEAFKPFGNLIVVPFFEPFYFVKNGSSHFGNSPF